MVIVECIMIHVLLFKGLIEEMYEWTKDEISKAPAHLLRFMAHVVLFFRTVGINTKVSKAIFVFPAVLWHI